MIYFPIENMPVSCDNCPFNCCLHSPCHVYLTGSRPENCPLKSADEEKINILDKIKKIIEQKMKEFDKSDCDKWNFCISMLSEIEEMRPRPPPCRQCGGSGRVIPLKSEEESVVCPKCKGKGSAVMDGITRFEKKWLQKDSPSIPLAINNNKRRK